MGRPDRLLSTLFRSGSVSFATWLIISVVTARTVTTGVPAHADATEPLIQIHQSGDVVTSLRADRRRMAIDDRLHLMLTVETQGGILVGLPQVGSRLGPFAVVGQNTSGPVTIEGPGEVWQHVFLLEPEAVGELVIPPLPVTLQDKAAVHAGTAERLTTEPLVIEVTSVLPPDPDITAPKEIAPPVELPRPIWSKLRPATAALAAGLLFLAWLWMRRRRRRTTSPRILRPAHIVALAELDRLQAEKALDPAETEKLYLRLSAILREYLAWRFELPVLAQTTEELLGHAAQADGPLAAQRGSIGRVLAECDLVKFARRLPDAARARQALATARDFVIETADERALVEVPGAY